MKKFFNRKTTKSSGYSPLCDAVVTDNVTEVKRLLAKPETNVNWCTKDGKTALAFACQKGNTFIVTLLFRHPGIHINSMDGNNMSQSAFYMALESNNEYIIQMFLKDSRFYRAKSLALVHYQSRDCGSLLYNLLFAYKYHNDIIVNDQLYHVYHQTAKDFIQRRKTGLQQAILDNQIRYKVKQQLAAGIFSLIVCVCDGLLYLRDVDPLTNMNIDINLNIKTHRFFYITRLLPMELQMAICYRTVGSMLNNILSAEINVALKHALV